MPFKIRTKLLIAFFAIIFPFILVGGTLVFYSANSIHHSVHVVRSVEEERAVITNLIISMETVLMPGNDYIITGNKKYIEDFYRVSKDIENNLKEAERLLEGEDEKRIISDTRTSWQNIRKTSEMIFDFEKPAGNRKAESLMERMDYTWAYPAIDKLKKLQDIHEKEYTDAINIADNVWVHSWLIMIMGSFLLSGIGIFFSFFYSNRFTQPIKEIHNSADEIASGNFKTRLVIRTGDEIEQLAEAMNKMALQLDDFYSRIAAFDITSQKRSEEAIRESETRFRSIVETATDAVVCLEEDGNVYIWNKAAEKMYGYTSAEVIGNDLHAMIVPERFRKKAYKSMADFFKTGKGPIVGKTVEVIGLKKDGTEFPVELSISSMSINNKWHAVGIMRDISSRKAAEDAVHRSKMEWEATVDSIQYPLFVHDRDFKIVRANMAYQMAAGMSFNNFIGRHYYDVFPKMDEPFEMCKNIIELENNNEEEFLYPTTNRIYKVRFFPIKDHTGRFLYSIHIMEDITETRIANDKIKQETEITANLLRIADATAHTSNIDKLLNQVVLCAQEIMKYDICLSYLWDKEANRFIPCQQTGITRELLPVFMTESFDDRSESIKKVLNTGSPVTVNTIQEKLFNWLPDIETIVLIPLSGRKVPLGIIIGIYRSPIKLSEREIKLMNGISHQVSIALEEARSYRDALDRAMELSRKVETIQVMHEIDKNILSTLKSEDILEITARMAGKVVSCNMVAVAQVDKDKRGVSYTAGFGTSLISKGAFIPFEETNAIEIIDTGLPQYVANLKDVKNSMGSEFPKGEEMLYEEGILSLIRVPVLVKNDVTAILSVGANRIAAFTTEDLSTLEKIAAQIGVALENARLITDLEEFFLGTVSTLSSAIDAKSPWTAGHSKRVTEYAVSISKAMSLSEKEIMDIELAGLLHDIGKIGTYERIIDKPGKLTDEEQAVMRQHPAKGAEILAPIKQLRDIIPAIKYHHECYDGTGYPEGLKGEAIPLGARILSVADTVDAMGADRPYRRGKPIEAIVAELKRCSGTQFDPVVVEAFLRKVA